jgi:Protein of unknown function (DUF3309)
MSIGTIILIILILILLGGFGGIGGSPFYGTGYYGGGGLGLARTSQSNIVGRGMMSVDYLLPWPAL